MGAPSGFRPQMTAQLHSFMQDSKDFDRAVPAGAMEQDVPRVAAALLQGRNMNRAEAGAYEVPAVGVQPLGVFRDGPDGLVEQLAISLELLRAPLLQAVAENLLIVGFGASRQAIACIRHNESQAFSASTASAISSSDSVA